MTTRLIAALLALSASVSAAPPPATHQTGRYIIKLKDKPTPPRLLVIADRLGGQYERGGTRSPYLLIAPKRKGRFALPQALRSLVSYVEPELVMQTRPVSIREHAQSTQGRPKRGVGEPAFSLDIGQPRRLQLPPGSVPNDPYFNFQWGFAGGNFGINLAQARGQSHGAGVIVAIIDSGVRASLPDLAGLSLLPPYSTLTGKSGGTDDNGHGSHVCGTIAQATDNGIGCAGIAPAVRILSVKALNAAGQGTNFTLGTAIRYAVDQGASIINLSVGGSPSKTLRDACIYAHSRDVLLVCSAGNSGQPALTYPAAYPEVFSVGAIGPTGRRATFSQSGPGLGIVAPGVDILQQTFVGAKVGYFYFSGTSMAAPMVSGVAALVKSLRPALSRRDLKLLLTSTATDLGPPGPDREYGAGLVNAAAACAKAMGIPPPVAPPLPIPEPIPEPILTPPLPTPIPTPFPPAEDPIRAAVLRLFNSERSKAGLPAVVMAPQLAAAAAAHAADMRARGVMSHTGGDGSDPGTRIARTGYPARTWGEIIGQRYPTPAAMVAGWMNSPGHKAIILGAQFSECGIAKDGAYWCATFGRR